MEKPSGATRCSREPVTAQSRATLPVLGGIFGCTSTTLSGAASASRKRACATGGGPICGSDMAGIAIIANPNARRNRSEWRDVGSSRRPEGEDRRSALAEQLRKAAPGAPLFETRTAADLGKAAKAIASEPPRVLAIAGGDGTVTHTVTALAKAMDGRVPPLALLGGGAYDSLAPLGGRGDAARRLRRLNEAVAAGVELRTVERDTLRVGARCGFRFGVGLPLRFIE